MYERCNQGLGGKASNISRQWDGGREDGRRDMKGTQWEKEGDTRKGGKGKYVPMTCQRSDSSA